MQKLSFFFISFFLCFSSFAQLRFGLFAGMANYQGDLVDKAYQSPRGTIGLTITYEVSPRINIRAGLSYAKLAGADSMSQKRELRLRNLSFQTGLEELSLTGEFNTFNLEEKTWSPYVFAGLAVYHFNPFTFDRNGNKVYLRPLSTEGEGLPSYPQSKRYSLTQLAVPFGGGIKYNINEQVLLALEIGLRKLFTDYLDDVSGNYADPNDLLAARGPESVALSYRGDEVPGGDLNYPSKGTQRGSPKYKDYYYFTGIHLSIRLPAGEGFSRERSYTGRHSRKVHYGCPTVF